jgi:hypothetical protein
MSADNPTSFRTSQGDGIVEMDGLIVAGSTFPVKKGTCYFVDALNGSNANNGRTWASPFLTMAKAFSVLESGDTIMFVGKVREQLTTPVQVFDVTIIGAGNRPRHADAEPEPVGGSSASTWTTPASGATTDPLVTVLQQGWRFVNILFAGPSDESCVELFRNGGAGDLERDASHAEFIGCRFASGQDGIVASGGIYGVLVQDCRFLAMTGYAIKSVVGAGIGAGDTSWQVFGNQITGCANGVLLSAITCAVKGNYFDDGGTPNTTTVLNMTGSAGGSGNNFIVDNYFQTTSANFNTPDIVGNATDVWRNFNIDGTFTSGGVMGLETGQPS